jgi:NAD(P)-dependent dehydrogenase (short-subunit alcohol dehydrogenase family)
MLIKLGGASGIGASLVEYCFHERALVCFADVAVEAGEALAKSLIASSFSEKPRAVFCQTDVAKYESVLDLFDTAFKTYGYIDHVVAVAGIADKGNPLDYNLTLETVRDVCGTSLYEFQERDILISRSLHLLKSSMSTSLGVYMLLVLPAYTFARIVHLM